MIINHNMQAMNTHRQLGVVGSYQAKSMEKLSSGYRINRAGDDAAGLAISEKMRGQIRGLSQASRNAQDGISLIQTAEGALNETHSILQRMRELAVQASSDTNTETDRGKIQSEIDQLTSEINRIGNTTEFNTMSLLNGERSITSRTETSTVRTVAIDQSFTANYADGVTAQAAMADTDVIQSGTITIANGEELANFAMGSGGSTVITITLNASGTEFDVVIEHTTSTGATFSSSDTLNFTTGSDFVFDDHGVSFTIEHEDFSKFAGAGQGIEIDVTTQFDDITGGAAVKTNSDWSSNDSGAITISTGVSLDVTNNADLEEARMARVTFTDSVTYTVEVFADTTATTAIVDDEVTLTAGSSFDNEAYDALGVSFNFSNTAGGTGQITFTLETTNTTASSAVVDNSLAFQIGANENQSMSLSLEDMRSVSLGISSTTAGVDGDAGFRASKAVTDGTNSTTSEYALDVSSFEAAKAAITSIDGALEKVSEERAKLGSVQNRLEHTIANLDTSAENLQSSESRIRDVDMAKEMMEYTKNNILMQAAQSMLAQANQAPQGVLSLLR